MIYGHRDFNQIVNAIQHQKPWAVMSGIKPSGHFHLGTLTTASEIVEFQKMGVLFIIQLLISNLLWIMECLTNKVLNMLLII